MEFGSSSHSPPGNLTWPCGVRSASWESQRFMNGSFQALLAHTGTACLTDTLLGSEEGATHREGPDGTGCPPLAPAPCQARQTPVFDVMEVR